MYHLFAGANYYPDSGLGDYVGPYEDEDEAVAEGERLCAPPEDGHYYHQDWWVVVTTDSAGSLTEVRRGYYER